VAASIQGQLVASRGRHSAKGTDSRKLMLHIEHTIVSASCATFPLFKFLCRPVSAIWNSKLVVQAAALSKALQHYRAEASAAITGRADVSRVSVDELNRRMGTVDSAVRHATSGAMATSNDRQWHHCAICKSINYVLSPRYYMCITITDGAFTSVLMQ
jgi:hypothetical protein